MIHPPIVAWQLTDCLELRGGIPALVATMAERNAMVRWPKSFLLLFDES
jgi:hypothetical protein